MICAVSSLELIYKKYGFHVLDRSIRLCVGTWEGEVGSLCAGILKGIAKLIVAFGDNLKDDVFKEKVGASSSRKICRVARERKGGTTGYAEAMLIEYNYKTRKGLDWAQLYSEKKRKRISEDEGYFGEEDEKQEIIDKSLL